jgi:hypothetical protein
MEQRLCNLAFAFRTFFLNPLLYLVTKFTVLAQNFAA